MADLEFFFDPACPFAYLTSRWVVEVREHNGLDVYWRPIALKYLNEHRADDPEYRAEFLPGHLVGFAGLRIAAELHDQLGNDAVDALYTAAGALIHRERRIAELIDEPRRGWEEVLRRAGLDPSFAAAADSGARDGELRASTELALRRVGEGVGTPVLTFHPGTDHENSFFGPVISSVPRGADAVRLYDAVATAAGFTTLSELKRTNRPKLDFG